MVYGDVAITVSRPLTADAFASPWRKSLNGQWKFAFAANPAAAGGFPSPLTTTSAIKEIAVPGNWQLQGYDKLVYVNVQYPFPTDDYPLRRMTTTRPAATAWPSPFPAAWTAGRSS